MGRKVLLYIVLLLSALSVQSSFAQDKANKETIKQANELFQTGKYAEAKPLFNQLVTFYPKDAEYNYKLGACKLFSESNKEEALKYLEYAASQFGVNPEAYYYLGKGYHYNYRFNEASINYNKFKSLASGKVLKVIPVDQDLRAAKNGSTVLKNITEPKVYERKVLSSKEYYLSYNPPTGVKLLKLPSFLQSNEDISNDFAPVSAIDRNAKRLLVSGINKGQSDLYWLTLDEEGNVEERTPITELNTGFDEGYPYFDSKTNILYFSSKGHNSMGGFDLFSSKYDEASGTFGPAENLDYAFNTPDDDFLYIPTEDGKVYFSSTRNNDFGSITVFLVDAERRGLSQALLVGAFTSETTKFAKITVEDSETGEKLPAFESRVDDGFYMTRLKSNHRYRFLVEPDGSDVVHAGIVEIPEINELKPLKQEMYIVQEGDREKLVIKNLFDEKASPEDEALVASFLSDVGKLEATEKEVEKNIALTNEEIIEELVEQEKVLKAQSADLMSYANAAYTVASNKEQLAKQDIELVNRLSANLPSSDAPDYQEKHDEVKKLKEDARTHSIEAASAIAFAQTLEELANDRNEEAALTNKTLNEVNQAVSENDRNSAVNAYLSLNDEVAVNKKPVKTQASEALTDKANNAKREASLSKQKYEDLFDEEQRLTKSIAFTQGQANQAKKPKMKKQLEQDLSNMRVDSSNLAPKVKNQYNDYLKKELIADALSNQSSNLSSILQEFDNNSASLSAEDRTNISSNVDKVYATTSQYGGREDYAFSSEEESSESSEEIVPNTPSEDNNVNQDLIPSNTEEEALAQVYNTEQSPYQGYYDEQEEEVSQIEDPYLKALNEEALYTAKEEAISAEIDYLATQEQTSEILSRTDELREERNQVNEKRATAEQILTNTSPSEASFQPNDGEMTYPSIQDLEDQYYFEFDEARSIENQSEYREKTNEINQSYLAQLEDTRLGLEEAQNQATSGSVEYETLGQEIEAIKSLEKKKKEHIAYNNQVNQGVPVSTYGFGSMGAAFAANTINAPKSSENESTNSESSNEEVSEVLASNDTGVETVEETTEEVEEFTAEVEDDEDLAFEATEVVDDNQQLTSAEESQPEEILDNGIPADGFKYFDNVEEVRRAPVYTGTSPYNKEYESKILTAQNNPDRLSSATTEKEANEAWLNDINKEIESLSYLSANASNDATREVLTEKISSLRTLKSERQAEVNRLAALEVQLIEEGYVAEVAQEEVLAENNDEELPISEEEENIGAEEPTNIEEEVIEVQETSSVETGESEAEIYEEPVFAEEAEEEVIEENSEEESFVEEESIQEEIIAAENEVEPNEEELALEETQTEEVEEVYEEPVVQEENTSFEEVGVAAVADATENDIDAALTETEVQAATNETSSENVETDIEKDELESLDNYLVSYEQEAITASEDYNETQSQIADLQSELAETKKKKEKREIQNQIDQLTEKSIMEQAMLRWKQAKAQSTQEAKEVLVANPLAERPSVGYLAKANKLEQEAQFLKQEVQEKEDEIGAEKKKKKRKKMLEELEPIKEEANTKLLEAEQAKELALAVQEAEVLTLKTTTAFSREIIVKLPSTDRTLTQQEQQQLRETSEFSDYNATRESFEKSIQEASVLYAEARRQESQGRELLSQADASSNEIADSLRASGNEEIRQAVNKRKRARALEREAYYAMNMANQELLAVEDSAFKSDLIAITQGSFSALTYTADGDIDVIPAQLSNDIFTQEGQNEAFYSEAKPIPVDVQLPNGVIYKVQVGAFSRPIPNETFKGFAPIVGESTASGLTRYTAGLFNQYQNANTAKNDIRALGYNDAFVVAYQNGERITLAQARASENGQTANPQTNETVAATQTLAENPLPVQDQDVVEITSPDELDVQSVSERGALFYTVQIGVYSQEVPPSALFNISPINSETTANGFIRYSTGVYSTAAAAGNARSRIQSIGIEDAFVTAYRDGERISVNEARNLASSTNPSSTAEIEVNPFADENQSEVDEDVQPIENTVEQEEENAEVELPPASAESDNAYRVKVGPYAGQVPVADAGVILGMNSVGINIDKTDSGTTYFIGNYATQAEADALLNIVREKGISDSEVVKFENGNIIE